MPPEFKRLEDLEKEKPSDTPEVKVGVSEETEAKRRLVLAETNAKVDAILHGYSIENPVKAWLEDFQKREQELKVAIEKNKNDTEALARQKDEYKQKLGDLKVKEQAIDEREIELVAQAEELGKLEEKKTAEVEAKIKAFLTKVLVRFEKGTVGVVEELAWWATQPLVKAAGYVAFHGCNDCIKPDAKLRIVEFDIPKRVSLDKCYDCDQPEICVDGHYESRRLPKYMCDLCPTQFVLSKIRTLCIELLLANGIQPKFDADYQYEKTAGKPKEPKELIAEMILRLKGENNIKTQQPPMIQRGGR